MAATAALSIAEKVTDPSVSHSDKRESRTGILSYLPDMCEAIVRTIGVDERRIPRGIWSESET
jgi:hypothetical protein